MNIEPSFNFPKLLPQIESDSCGEASPCVGVGNGPGNGAGNRAGNRESTVKDFHLLASIFNQKMIISVKLDLSELYIILTCCLE